VTSRAVASLFTHPPVLEVAKAAFLALAVLDLWIILDTRRALRVLQRHGLWHTPETPFWIWFYRIDGAVVLIWGTYLYVSGRFLR
jgi:hypothetical protein